MRAKLLLLLILIPFVMGFGEGEFDYSELHPYLYDITQLAPDDSYFIVGDGTDWIRETGSTVRTSLGLAIGSDVQAWDAQLDDIAALAVTDGNFIVGDGNNWVAESGNTARTSLGLGNVENTALSTWLGTSSITTLGTITTGIWNAGAVTSSGAITGPSFVIGANTLDTTEWAFLDGLDQRVDINSSPTFAGLLVDKGTAELEIVIHDKLGFDMAEIDMTVINGATHLGSILGALYIREVTGQGASTLLFSDDDVTDSAQIQYKVVTDILEFENAAGYLFDNNVRIGSAVTPTVALDVTGETKISGLAGGGDRYVYADNNGQLKAGAAYP